MPYITSHHDGAQLFYRDYRPATMTKAAAAAKPQPFRANDAACRSPPRVTLVFVHGWPMSSLMYDHLMLRLCETERIRCVAIDRRGFGKSDWSGSGAGADADASREITYETFADDTVGVVEHLRLESFVFVAASMGCGETVLAWERSEVVRKGCKGFIWIGASLPYPLQTADNPTAPSRELWDSILTALRTSRASFVQASLPNLFGAHVGTEVDAAILARFERIVDQADSLAMERCVQIITCYDFTERLKSLAGKPVLVLQGDSDKGMPYEAGTKLIEALIPNARVSMYDKAGHGLYVTHAEKVVEDIVGFVKGLGEQESIVADGRHL